MLPALRALLQRRRREAVLLVKPQFEVGRERVGKGGVVRDPAAHARGHRDGDDGGRGSWTGTRRACWPHPITGPAGNHEYLLWLVPPESAAAAGVAQAEWPDRIQALVEGTLAGG